MCTRKGCNGDDPDAGETDCTEASDLCPVAGCMPPPANCKLVEGDLFMNVEGTCCRKMCQTECTGATLDTPASVIFSKQLSKCQICADSTADNCDVTVVERWVCCSGFW